jgi:GDP-4-dehydro-6-deoxy-D-mannose reductase
MRRALITGVNGFVGQYLWHELVHHGWQVYGLGLSNFEAEGVFYLPCDITDPESIKQVVRTVMPDVVFHLASITPLQRPKVDQYYRVNVVGTVNLLEAVHQFVPSAKVILVTSSAMYGCASSPDGVIDESEPLLPVNAYGVSKAAQHMLGYQYATQYGLRIVRVCPFNIVGEGIPRGLVAADFGFQLAAIELGHQQPIIEVGDIGAVRDFLDVHDVVRAYRLLIEVGEPGANYNLASGRPTRVQDILTILIKLSGLSVQVQERSGAVAANPIPIQIGTNARLRAVIDWQPEIPLERSLQNVLNFCRKSFRER